MPASSTVGQRFTQLIQHLGLSKNAFALSLDKTATVIQHLVEERNKPGFDLLCKVFEVYPNVSKDWLLLGQEPMLTAAAPAPMLPMEPIDLAELTGPPRRPRANGTHLQPADIAATLALASPPRPAPAAAPAARPALGAPAEAAASISAASAAAVATTPVPVAPPAPDASYQLAGWLHTQQLQHQLALAEQRNQHLLAQQALMQQLVDVLRTI